MAERRMFAKTIIDSDAFLEMPLSTQALYFHLGMRADDDGFVNSPKRIMRLVSCSEDDMKLLIAKNFIIPFESGIVVIKHWKIHNYIRSDRYKETAYTEEKSLLKTKENNAYTLIEPLGIPGDIPLGIPGDIPMGDAGKDRIGKVSLGKDRLDNNVLPKPKELKEEFATLWSMYPKKQGKEKAFGYYQKARKCGSTYEEVGRGIVAYLDYIKANEVDSQYVKMGSTFFSQKAWQDDWTIRNRPQQRRGGINTVFAEIFEEHKDDI